MPSITYSATLMLAPVARRAGATPIESAPPSIVRSSTRPKIRTPRFALRSRDSVEPMVPAIHNSVCGAASKTRGQISSMKWLSESSLPAWLDPMKTTLAVPDARGS